MNTLDNNRALIVGVGADLPCTVRDAEHIYKYLTDPQRCGFAPDKAQLLTGETAKRDDILAALDQLAQHTLPESTVIVYFSGHGYVRTDESTGGQSYWLMPFGYDLRKLRTTAIPGSLFSQKLAAVQAQRLLLILDCCHAGGISDDKSDEAKSLDATFAKSAMPPEVVAQFQTGSGRFIIASCKDTEKSLIGDPVSLFTRALIAALCGTGAAKQDGFVRVQDLFGHTRQVVPGWAKKLGGEQTPVADTEAPTDNFVVAHYAKANFGKGDKSPLPLDLPELDFESAKELNAAPTVSYTATLNGDGANAQGKDAKAVGKGGVMIGGNNQGDINTGSQMTIRRNRNR